MSEATQEQDIMDVCEFISDTESRVLVSGGLPHGYPAMITELAEKARNFNSPSDSDREKNEKLIELKQAADSVLRFTEESTAITESLKEQLREVHQKIIRLKEENYH